MTPTEAEEKPPPVLDHVERGVMRIVLNRPEAANAIAAAARDRLIELFERAGADPDVRVVVLSSTGKHFCSGADVAGLGRADKRVGDPMHRIMVGAQKLVASVLDCPKPVVAAVQGTAAGLGAHLVYASDFAVAADSATFIEAFVRRGIVIDSGGAYLLPRLIGLQKAKELAFLGDSLDATQACALGLLNRVVPVEQLAAGVDELAERLAAAPTSSLSLMKRLFNRSLDADRQESFLLEAMAQEMQSYSHDSREGIQAFRERRDPRFEGR